MGESISIFRRWLYAAALLLLMTTACEIAAETRSFDLEAGSASTTLREFARQASVSVVMNRQNIQGVQTNEVSGLLAPKHALERMLEGTSLVFNEDLETGAFAVTRSKVSVAELTTQGSGVQIPESEHKPKNAKPMKIKKKTISGLFKGLLALAVASAPSVSAQDKGEEVYELSPFTVDGSSDVGYRATSTLAGTRLNTQLKDVGAAISVMTKELFDDIGATDSTTLLSYGLNTETSGAQGNYVGGNSVVGATTADLADTRVNPQQGQRIRGLASADLTRNYFQTDIPFDAYNTDRVTISRGPNSLLFGIGSPGGVIDNTTLQASTSQDSGEFSIRLGERSSHRETFNVNTVLIENRLGVRIASMYDKFNYQQRPTFDEKNRLYVALNGVLLENNKSEVFDKTIFKVNYEKGEEKSNPPIVTPPGDGISAWLTGVDPSLENIPGVVFPGRLQNFTPKWTVDQRSVADGGSGILVEADFPGPVALPNFIQMSLVYEDVTNGAGPGTTGTPHDARIWRTLNSFNGRGGRNWDYWFTDSIFNENYVPNFTIPSLPLSVFDNENMSLAGTTNRVNRDFDTVNVSLEQTLWKGKAGIEVSYDKQKYDTRASLPYSTGAFQVSYNTVSVDVQEYLNDGTPNPNVGRAVIHTGSNIQGGNARSEILGLTEVDREREATRVTAFADIDFSNKDNASKWLGRHVVTGLLSTQKLDTTNRNFEGAWDSETVDIGSNDYHFDNLNGFRRAVISQTYLTPQLHNDSSVNSLADVKISNYIDIDLPTDGEGFQGLTYNRKTGKFENVGLEARQYLDAFSRNIREIDTQILSMQSFFLNGHVVGLVGFRNDEQSTLINPNVPRFPSGEVDLESANFLEPPRNPITGEFEQPEDGNTTTWSVVAHMPDSIMDKLPITGLSFHYNESENFNPVGVRTDIEGFQIASPGSETTEYGFTLNLFEDRLSLRANWFETSEVNGTGTANPLDVAGRIGDWTFRWLEAERSGLTIDQSLAAAGFPAGFWGSYEEAFNTLVDLLPANVKSVANYRREVQNGNLVIENDFDLLQNIGSTRDFIAEGFELDLVGQITKNWRVMLNVGQQKTIQNNIGPKTLALGAALNANIQAAPYLNFQDDPQRVEITFANRWAQNFARLLSAVSQEGTVSLEQRRWRWNAVTNYTFSEGRFKDFGVGAAARWQDKAATGYPLLPLNADGIALPDLANPFFGPDQLNGDLWFSYGKKIIDDKVDWKIQLNLRNAFGDDDIIPVTTNPNGELAIFRNSLPKEVFLTNSFSF